MEKLGKKEKKERDPISNEGGGGGGEDNLHGWEVMSMNTSVVISWGYNIETNI